MTLIEVFEYYGGRERMANETGYSAARIRLWVFRGAIPLRAQLHIQDLTKGQLVAHDDA